MQWKEAFLEEYKDWVPLFKRLLTENLGVTNERVLILGDDGEPGHRVGPRINALYEAACRELGLDTTVIAQSVKLRGDVAEPHVIHALDQLPRESIILLNTSGRIGNLSTLGLSYRKFCRERGHRFFSSSNWSFVEDKRFDEVLKAFDVDYRALSQEGAALKQRLDAAKTVRVTTAAGTDLTIDKEGMLAINNDGFYLTPGQGGNMPAGEVYFPPRGTRNVHGRIVIDGSYRTKDASLIPVEPIVIEVEDGAMRIVNDTPEAQALERTLQWAEQRAKYPWGIRRVCELGIGLNPGSTLIGCTILDEKVRGTVHFAHGSNKWFGGKIAAIIHLDHVLKNPRLFLDGEELELPKV